jgi:hypothetical protein
VSGPVWLPQAQLLVHVVHLQDRLSLDSASMLALEGLAASGQRQHLADDRPQVALVDAVVELDELGARFASTTTKTPRAPSC